MVVIMPFTGDVSRPDLVHRKIVSVKVDAVLAPVFTAPMSVEVVGANSEGPNTSHSENRDREAHSANEVKYGEPEGPIQDVVSDRAHGMTERSPAPVLSVGIQFHARVTHEFFQLLVFFDVEILRDELMVGVREEAVKPAAMDVIWVARLFGFPMMNVVGNHVDLFGDHFDGEVSHDESGERVTEDVRSMGRIPMEVDRSVSAHHDHAVEEAAEEKPEVEMMGEENKERNGEREGEKPADER